MRRCRLAFEPDFPSSLTRFDLTNFRRDVYDSFSVTFHQTFGRDYSWMANYTRSRALSNSVIDVSVDQRLQVINNFGRLSWDAPDRVLSWGYLPAWSRNWAFSYLLDLRTGFPFSIVRDTGQIVGTVNSWRFPVNVRLNVHLERKFRLGQVPFRLARGNEQRDQLDERHRREQQYRFSQLPAVLREGRTARCIPAPLAKAGRVKLIIGAVRMRRTGRLSPTERTPAGNSSCSFPPKPKELHGLQLFAWTSKSTSVRSCFGRSWFMRTSAPCHFHGRNHG